VLASGGGGGGRTGFEGDLNTMRKEMDGEQGGSSTDHAWCYCWGLLDTSGLEGLSDEEARERESRVHWKQSLGMGG